MGGILALALAFGLIFGARKFCNLIGAPLWFAKFLFICASLVATYLIADVEIPYYNKPWGVWVAMLCASAGIIPAGFFLFKHIEEDEERKARLDRDNQDF